MGWAEPLSDVGRGAPGRDCLLAVQVPQSQHQHFITFCRRMHISVHNESERAGGNKSE